MGIARTMQLIAGPRGSGKTAEAIKLANEHGAYLAVRNKKFAREVYHREGYPDLDRFPITHEALQRGTLRGSNVKKVVIDDLDAFLASVIPGLRIQGMTVTVGEHAEVKQLEEIHGQ